MLFILINAVVDDNHFVICNILFGCIEIEIGGKAFCIDFLATFSFVCDFQTYMMEKI